MESEELQKKVDKAKAVGLMNGLHDITPPSSKAINESGQIAIIESLKVTPRLKDIFMELRGLMWLESENKYVQVARPIMNIDGAFRFVKILQHIAEEVEFSNFKEEELDARILAYFEQNYPYFTFWHEEYELLPSDFNFVESTMMVFIDSAFHKSKSGKYINAVARVYSEDFLAKTLGSESEKKKKSQGLFSELNPFKRK